MITVITIEGVLARGDDLRTAPAHKTAKSLYDGMKSQTNMFGLTKADPEIAHWWLKREHLDGWSQVMTWPGTIIWNLWRPDQVREFLAESWEIMAYVDSEAAVCQAVRAMGVTTLCVSYPEVIPGWKEPTTSPRSWAEVSRTL